MTINIIVPKAGLTMTEATVATWLVSEGDLVKKDDVIVDLMTEKITVEVTAPESGVIETILKHEGEEVKVGETLATLSNNNEKVPNNLNSNIQKGQPAKSTIINDRASKMYDVAVIGGGPGGYVAAIRAAQMGGKVVLIESNELGGVCLNSGCIPTKTLLKGAELTKLYEVSNEFGISYDPPTVQFSKLIDKKDSIVNQLKEGIAHLLKRNDVTVLKGYGNVISPQMVNVLESDGQLKTIECKNIILATGSETSIPNIPGLNEANPITSKEALKLRELPESIAIIGGGAIGCEFAGIYAPLGVKVVLIESENDILPGSDSDISQYLRKALQKDGVEILTSSMVKEIKVEKDQKTLFIEQKQKDNYQEIVVKEILVATGRKPRLQNIREIGLEIENNRIKVDEYLRTSERNIFAIGDLTGIESLAHVASAQGIIAAENCMGQLKKMNYQYIPRCIYTSPEIASVGFTEKEAQDRGMQYKIGKHFFSRNGRALTNGKAEGFIKVIRENKYNQILGIHIVGVNASELISEGVLALNLEATTDELIATIHPHPTLSEGMLEAALDSLGQAIHV